MAKQYEPFLINPPKRLPKLRRSRMFSKPYFRKNAAVEDDEAFDAEWNREKLRKSLSTTAPAGMTVGTKPRKKLSKKAQRSSSLLSTRAEIAQFNKDVAAAKRHLKAAGKVTKKKKGKKVTKVAKKAKRKGIKIVRAGKTRLRLVQGGSMAKKKTAKRKVVKKAAKRVSKKRKVSMRKGSVKAIKWGKLMAKLRKAKGTKVAKRKKTTVKASRKRVAKKRVAVSKRKYTSKSLHGQKRRHVAVARYAKAWRTVPGVHKPFRAGVKVNPFRRNPFGSELMVVGANPRRKKSRKSGGNMSKKRKRFMSNPISSIKALAPMIAGGTVGALATKQMPKWLGMTNVWAGYGTQVATIAAGAYLVDKFSGKYGKSVADGWIIGGASMVLSNVLSNTVGGVLAGLGLDYDSLSAFPEQQTMQAFPEGGMGMLDNEGMAGEYDIESMY
jgi:hypothetical protein